VMHTLAVASTAGEPMLVPGDPHREAREPSERSFIPTAVGRRRCRSSGRARRRGSRH
jgi:hypothetical protein